MCCSESVRRCPGRQNARAGVRAWRAANEYCGSFTSICPATTGKNGRRHRSTRFWIYSPCQPLEPIGKFIPSAIAPLGLPFFRWGYNHLSKRQCSHKHGTVTPNTYTLSSRLVAAPSRQTVTNPAPSKRAVHTTITYTIFNLIHSPFSPAQVPPCS
jgi:hypothetical protein